MRGARSSSVGSSAMSYADGPGQLDWANQPNPFRRYEGAPLVRLPLLAAHEAPRSPYYDDLYHHGSVPSAPLTIHALSRLLQYATMTGESWAQGQVVLSVRFEPQLQVPNNVIDTVGRYLGSALRLGEDESTLENGLGVERE